MKVIEKLILEIPGTNTHYFKLENYSNQNSNECLYFGYTFLENGTDQSFLSSFERNVYLNVTMPTEFCSPQSTDADNNFDEIWTICPYSNKWLNEIKNTNKYKTIFYPFNRQDIPKTSQKKYDVVYHGGLHGEKYVEMIKIISKYNYRYVTQTYGINQLTQSMMSYATNTNLTNEDKIKIISESKISICFNSFEVRGVSDLQNVKSRKEWQKNEAFKHIDDLKIIPQFKSRCNEAAFSKTLNLVQRDPWNIIERYYDKDEFVYFDSIIDLPEKIDYILNNWESHLPIVEKAYKRSLEYTSENLYNIIKNKENKYDL